MPYDFIYITVIDVEGIRTLHKISPFVRLTLLDLFITDENCKACKSSAKTCSKCHIKVLNGWEKIPAVADDEMVKLNMFKNAERNSRLACNVPVKADFNGMIIKIVEPV